ncbi:hypothetical protein T265_01317 [Opisthorchis viverrini]|uniref:Uncharacterized protein n=1 Tax=Opisthorchis viverrini TaxID=6198 RepID=A0A075AA43_OPIVI|nr:hypothetical protein T265_01317 [Opisthorchis viverrini]KER32630.1 hypothetical protein T265_01317 [Opisthorchis viverrini]
MTPSGHSVEVRTEIVIKSGGYSPAILDDTVSMNKSLSWSLGQDNSVDVSFVISSTVVKSVFLLSMSMSCLSPQPEFQLDNGRFRRFTCFLKSLPCFNCIGQPIDRLNNTCMHFVPTQLELFGLE